MEFGIKTLDDISFAAYGGEILGIAGIAGSGQRELLEAISGLQSLNGGEIVYYDPKNNDNTVDWNDGAIAFRDVMHYAYGTEAVKDMVKHKIVNVLGSNDKI